MAVATDIIPVALDLDRSGLIWHPEIGDEIAERSRLERIAILVDPLGMTPSELRQSFLWLPTVEQIVIQIEARQGVVYHAGVNKAFQYETVIRVGEGLIEVTAPTLRIAFSKALRDLLNHSTTEVIH